MKYFDKVISEGFTVNLELNIDSNNYEITVSNDVRWQRTKIDRGQFSEEVFDFLVNECYEVIKLRETNNE